MGADGHLEIYDLDKAIELGLINDPYKKDLEKNDEEEDLEKDDEEEDSEEDEKEKISFYDLDKILQSEHIYMRSIFGRRVITSYWDTEHYNNYRNVKLTEREKEIADILYKECHVDTWEVWT